MIAKKFSKNRLVRAVFGGLFAIMVMFAGIVPVTMPVYAEPISETDGIHEVIDEITGDDTIEEDVTSENTTTENTATTNTATESTPTENSAKSCQDSLGAIGWLVCPTTGKISEAVDWLYEKIEDILVINPVEMKDGSPIYEIWKYMRGITNIVFIIFCLVMVYSQLTGVGITNYGLKKTLPKLIVAAILVNLSFVICSLAVDVSNIVGSGLRDVFTSVEESAVSSMNVSAGSGLRLSEMYSTMAGGSAVALGAGMIAFETGAIWMLIPTVLGAIVAVVTGLVTIALRQAVVALLIMIAPLAIIAYMLPNTEQWFKKWKSLLTRMLVFYPMFSLLFGASSLAGFAIVASAKDGFGVLLGIAVQVFPLFFSWSLMKMSGTILGTINSKLNGLAARPLAANRGWAESKRQQTNMNMLAYGRTPFSHLRRYVDGRKALREKDIENLQTTHKNNVNTYVQRKISGYDGTKTQGTSEELKPNKYAQHAKDASTSYLKSETAAMDTAHVISYYGNYFVPRNVREQVEAAEKAGDKEKVARIMAGNAELRRDVAGGQAFLEYGRAQMTKENDEEADFGFMSSQFLDSSTNYDPNAPDTAENKQKMEKYRHYIVSSAGGLGEMGQTRVLGKIIARAAAVESNQRRDIGIIASKFPPDKRNFRNFLFNYYIDDDGYATDKEGNRIESMRDYLRVNDPEKLVMWDHYDENGPYYDWYDVNGKYVTRIYKKDKSAIKELMSNFDAPINDPINNMLAIHAGIKEQPNSEIPVLRNMGLDAFRTTVGRALMSAPFKEKNAAFSPMVAEMVKKGYIQNYAQEYLAYLDSFNKATKPGAFNIQDADAINMFAMMMDPDEWDKIFPTELIRGFRNVNGERIYGVRYGKDENGEDVKIKVPADEATRDELMKRIFEKYIEPAAPKIIAMMSRQTQNTMDNQKPGTAEAWKRLKEVFDKKWVEEPEKVLSETFGEEWINRSGIEAKKEIQEKIQEIDPYEQKGDMSEIKNDIRYGIYTIDDNGNKKYIYRGGKNKNKNKNGSNKHYRNHSAQIFEIYNSTLDADDFATAVSEYLYSYPETVWIAEQLQDFIDGQGYGVEKDDIKNWIDEQLVCVDND